MSQAAGPVQPWAGVGPGVDRGTRWGQGPLAGLRWEEAERALGGTPKHSSQALGASCV